VADHPRLVRAGRSPVSPQKHLTVNAKREKREKRCLIYFLRRKRCQIYFSTTIVMDTWRNYRYVVIAILNERPSAGFVLV
jgi:hypothetical protein